MSTNFKIEGIREIVVNKTGGMETQHIFFSEVWQTPTSITTQLLAADFPLEAYKLWVSSKESHEGKDHCKSLDKWVKSAEEGGYTLVFYGM